MSDGPHRSLPMRKGWKKLAEQADLRAFDTSEIAENVPGALHEDWTEERCNEFAREIGYALGVSNETPLFPRSKEELLEGLRHIPGSGYPLRRILVDAVRQAVEDGLSGQAALVKGTADALAIRCSAGTRQVEEHYLRKSTDARAANVRSRIEEGAANTDFTGAARSFLKLDKSSASAPVNKRDGLDDGVRL